jgi:hypothetical protein
MNDVLNVNGVGVTPVAVKDRLNTLYGVVTVMVLDTVAADVGVYVKTYVQLALAGTSVPHEPELVKPVGSALKVTGMPDDPGLVMV